MALVILLDETRSFQSREQGSEPTNTNASARYSNVPQSTKSWHTECPDVAFHGFRRGGDAEYFYSDEQKILAGPIGERGKPGVHKVPERVSLFVVFWNVQSN